MPRPSAARWCAISAAMASAGCSTTRPTSCTTAAPNEGVEMRPGMIFTIEPMINLGRPHVKVLSDGWTAVTRDRSLSAQYEHTVGVTATGCEIFTLSPKGARPPGPARIRLILPRLARQVPDMVQASYPAADESDQAAWRRTARRARLLAEQPLRPIWRNAEQPAQAKSRTIPATATAARTVSRGRRRTRLPTTKCSKCCCSARYRAPTPSRGPRRC